jgi:hypothetical protein
MPHTNMHSEALITYEDDLALVEALKQRQWLTAVTAADRQKIEAQLMIIRTKKALRLTSP